MTNLKPVDFKAVAAKGAFVYCYLRHSDSKTAAANTPYYVGVAISNRSGQRHRRPLNPSHHHAGVPFDKSLIRVLRSGLTKAQAERWEIFYIAHYGRKADGGILVNQAEGGNVNTGWNHSEEWKKANSARMQHREITWGCKISKAKTGAKVAPWTAERRANFVASESQINSGRKLGQAWKGKKRDQVSVTQGSETKKIKKAEQMGVDSSWYLTLADHTRRALAARFKRGKRGADLVAGLAAA